MKPLLSALSISAFTLAASTLSAQVITPTPTLPASPPAYYGSSSFIGYSIPGLGTIYLGDFALSGWTPTTFNNALLAADFTQTPPGLQLIPTTEIGSGAWTGNNPNTTGTFATEMTALSLTDNGLFGSQLQLRESPTLASTG